VSTLVEKLFLHFYNYCDNIKSQVERRNLYDQK
jgi:hypothetical protein